MSIFSKVKVTKPRRSNFDLSFDSKLTTNFGRLTPFLCKEVLPGDSWRVSSNLFVRMMPMLAPIMNKVDVYTHYFFVPNRLLWSKWQDFVTGGEKGDKFPLMPTINLKYLYENGLLGKGSLADYLGLPVGDRVQDCGVSEVCALPFRAYQLIYNEWYRDQNLEEEIYIGKDNSGSMNDSHSVDYHSLGTIRYRAWKKDYFTSALPWPQRGPEVTLPFADAPIKNKFNEGHNTTVPTYGMALTNDGELDYTSQVRQLGLGNADPNTGQRVLTDAETGNAVSFSGKGLYADMGAVNPTINELRRSVRVQEWLEKSARGGARYVEQILSHFGVVSSDARLQRPELLGGGKSPIMISEVVQTSDDGKAPLGNMGGHGVSANSTHAFKRYFEEHGYIIGIMSIMPKASYYGGIDRSWMRRDKFDFAWPEFANIGEQPIANYELNAYIDDPDLANDTFGYTPRYSEYKYSNSTIHGEFRDTLKFWHLGREFDSQNNIPLNSDFIRCGGTPSKDKELNRIFATESGDHFIIQVLNNIVAKRPLPYYGTPNL